MGVVGSEPRKPVNAVEFDGLVKELEVRLDQLKALYDQYFQGLERLPPTKKRESIERALKELRRDQPRNTASRFRFQTLWQRWVTMTTHWDRVSRQIEEGTYKRDVLRAQRRRQRVASAEPRTSIEVDVDVDIDDFDFDAEVGAALDGLRDDRTDPEIALPPSRAAVVPEAPRGRPMPEAPQPRAMPEAPRPATPVAPFSQPRITPFSSPAPAASSPGSPAMASFGKPKEASFRKPVESTPPQSGAVRVTPERPAGPRIEPRHGGERTSMSAPPPPPTTAPRRPPATELGETELRRIHAQYVAAGGGTMPYEKLAKQIKTMEPELKKKHGGKAIDFEVVVKDGRVGLKPVARE